VVQEAQACFLFVAYPAHRGNLRTDNQADQLIGRLGTVTIPAERDDCHVFVKTLQIVDAVLYNV
jgi:hypothetical protein